MGPNFPIPQSFVAREGSGRDLWETFTVTRTGWTDVGTPTVVGRYHQVGRAVEGTIEVTPSTSVATTAGTSYVELPITAAGYGSGSMQNVSTNIAIGACVVDRTNSRLYVPTQAATGNTLVIWFSYEV